MKKTILFAFLWCLLLSVPVEAKKRELTYRIRFDSNETNLVTIKNELIEQTKTYFDSVDIESSDVLFQNDLSVLEGENRIVTYRNNELRFTLGDGKGETIRGNFKQNSFCVEEVKPVSLFQQWFHW